MDFLDKFKLGFEWDDVDQTQLFIRDKRSQIKDELQIVTVPSSVPRLHYLDSHPSRVVEPVRVPNEAAEVAAFELACMKALDPENKNKISLEDSLKVHAPEYQDLLKSFPKLLNPSFKKGEPVHGVYHKIETQGPPVTTKRRPIIANKAKNDAGKAAWEKMERDGVIERLPPDTPTSYTSALHLVDKPGGGVRPCSDFRALNTQTVPDVFPLPLLRDFTSKISGCNLFSVIDIRQAFFNIPIWPSHRYKTATLSPWGGTLMIPWC